MTNYMQQNEIAHNVFFTRGSTLEPKDDDPQTTIRVYIWPRKKFLGRDSVFSNRSVDQVILTAL